MTREKRQQGKRKRHRNKGYDFSDKVHSQKGIISVVLAAVSFIGLIGLVIASTMEKGNGSIGIGAGGFTILCIIVVGFIMGILSFRETEIKHTFPLIGTICNGILLVFEVIICFIGMMS